MKIATYSISTVLKPGLPALTDWLNEAQPDVVLLQEIKSVDDGFSLCSILKTWAIRVEVTWAKGLQRGGYPVKAAA